MNPKKIYVAGRLLQRKLWGKSPKEITYRFLAGYRKCLFLPKEVSQNID